MHRRWPGRGGGPALADPGGDSPSEESWKGFLRSAVAPTRLRQAFGLARRIHLPSAFPPPCLPTGPKDFKKLSQTAQKWSLGGSGGHFVTKMAPSLLKIAQNWSLGASKLDPGDLLGPHGAPFGTMWDPLGLPMDPLWVPRCKKTKKSGSVTAQCG